MNSNKIEDFFIVITLVFFCRMKQSTLSNFILKSERIKQFITLCTLFDDDEVKQIVSNHNEYLGKLSEFFVPFGWEMCDACHKYRTTTLYEDVEAYKDYKENVCFECVGYCGICEVAYAPSGNYKHEECLSNASSKIKRHEARKRKAKWLEITTEEDTDSEEGEKH